MIGIIAKRSKIGRIKTSDCPKPMGSTIPRPVLKFGEALLRGTVQHQNYAGKHQVTRNVCRLCRANMAGTGICRAAGIILPRAVP
jgi:hypothetical protein